REVRGVEHWADLDLRLFTGHWIRAAAHPFDGLSHRVHLPKPEARNELLCLTKGSVNDGALGPAKLDALALRARVEALAGEQHAGLDELLVALAPIRAQLLAGHRTRLGILGRLDNYHHSHGHFSCVDGACSYRRRLLRIVIRA